MTDQENANTPTTDRPRRQASLISRRFLRRRLKELTKSRVTVEALDAAEAHLERQFGRMVEVAIRELEREANARAKQNVRFRTPPLRRAHLAPFIDPAVEPPRGAVSSLGPQGVHVGRTDTPEPA